jgi:hypothetical protein
MKYNKPLALVLFTCHIISILSRNWEYNFIFSGINSGCVGVFCANLWIGNFYKILYENLKKALDNHISQIEREIESREDMIGSTFEKIKENLK